MVALFRDERRNDMLAGRRSEAENVLPDQQDADFARSRSSSDYSFVCRLQLYMYIALGVPEFV